MMFELLSHAISDKYLKKIMESLVARNVISSVEGTAVKSEKKAQDKLKLLLSTLRLKSAAEFEEFLKTLSETEHLQSVAKRLQEFLRIFHATSGHAFIDSALESRRGKHFNLVLYAFLDYIASRFTEICNLRSSNHFSCNTLLSPLTMRMNGDV
jgi:Caspase recruitment domain